MPFARPRMSGVHPASADREAARAGSNHWRGASVTAASLALVVVLGLPHGPGVQAAECGAPGDPTTTIYLPNITKTLGGASGWVTPFIVQNIGTTSTTLEVSFYDFSSGSLVACRNVGVFAPGSSFADVPNEDPDLPGNSQFAVVVRSFGSEVVSVVNEHQGSGARAEAGSYVGLTTGSSLLSLPYVAKTSDGQLTTVVIQNLGATVASTTAAFRRYQTGAQFSEDAAAATLTRTIAPGRSVFIDPRFESALADGAEYALTVTSTQPIAAIANVHRDATTDPYPTLFSYNAVGSAGTSSYLPYLPRNVEGRTAQLRIQNLGAASATPTVQLRALQGGARVSVTAPRAIAPGAAWVHTLGTASDGIPCPATGTESCAANGEWSAVVTGGHFAVLASARSATTVFGYTSAGTGTRVYLPNVTRTLGGTLGWSTPVILQSAGATNATVYWYRFADGKLVLISPISGLVDGGSVKIDPREAPLADATQYAVVIDSPGHIAGITTEYNFQGGDGAMVYEGFARVGGVPLPIFVPPTPAASPTLRPTVPVRITQVFYDGSVPAVESDEFVEFKNEWMGAVDLTGWRLQSVRGGQAYAFPAGSVMSIGQTCRVYTNEYHPDWCGFNWGKSTSAMWNNSGDRANLLDASGRVVSSFGYGGY